MSRVCPKCGRNIEKLVKFCPVCGSELPAESQVSLDSEGHELYGSSSSAPVTHSHFGSDDYDSSREFDPPRIQLTQKKRSPGSLAVIFRILIVAAVLAAGGYFSFKLYSEAEMADYFKPLDGGYAGAFSDTMEYMKFEKELPAVREKALKLIAERIGLELPPNKTIPIYVADCQRVKGIPMGVLAFATQYKKYQSHRTYVIFCYDFFAMINEYIPNLEISVESVLNHELVHAVMAENMGFDEMMKLPIWFIEGSAEYGSGQGRDRLHLMKFFGLGKPTFMVSIKKDQENHTGEDYATDYLHFLFVRDIDKGNITAGERRVRELIRDVAVNKIPLEKAVEKNTGMKFEDFQRQAMIYAKEKYKEY